MKFKIIIFESLFIIFLPTIDDSSRISFENDVFVSLDQFKKDEEKKEIKKNFIASWTTEDCNIKLESRKIQLQ